MSALVVLRMGLRQLRGGAGRALFFAGCLAVAVAALAGVGAVTGSVEASLRGSARDLLGGDLAIEARRPLPPLEPILPASARTAPRVGITMLASMVQADGGRSRLVELKAFEGPYPLTGQLATQPSDALAKLGDDAVLVAPALVKELGLVVGARLHVGTAWLRVAGTVESEPDARGFTFTLGPRVLMTRAALEQTGLLGFGSRILHRVVFVLPALSDAALDTLKQTITTAVEGGGVQTSVETRAEAQPQLRMALARVRQYLGLVALFSLLVSSVGCAQMVAAWLARARREIAVLRCLGMAPSAVIGVYLVHLIVLSALGSALGALLGLAAPSALASFAPSLVAEGLTWDAAVLVPVLRAAATGMLLPIVFSLPALLAVQRVPPAEVVRAEAEPVPIGLGLRLASFLAVAAGLVGATFATSESLSVALGASAALATWTALLGLAGWALIALVTARPSPRLSAPLRHGLAALRRPNAGALGGIVALGLGTTVLVALLLVARTLNGELAASVPARAPSLFLLDVQPDQWSEVAALCREAGATDLASVPVAMARLTAIDGVTTDRLVKQRPGNPNERGRSHWVLTREQRLSWAKELPPDNHLVEGALWSMPGVDEVSLERDFARDLGVHLGSVLRFDLQGVPITLTVSSIRTVSWRSFSANFFMVVEPGVLDEAPHTRLGLLRIDPAREQLVQDRLASTFSNVTVLRVRELTERVVGILDRVSSAVRLLAAVSVLSGVLVLIGGVVASGTRRVREAALLRALGVRRREIASLVAVEYALRGALAGALGAGGGYLLAALFARYVLELTTQPSWIVAGATLALVLTLSVAFGLLASARALRVSGLAALRGAGR